MDNLPGLGLETKTSQLDSKHSQNGQALLIVLLSMAVILTIVLSVASRSVTDVTVTTYEEDALRAFSAAEAGVETALLNPAVGPIPTPASLLDPNDTTVQYTGQVNDPQETDRRFTYPSEIASGEVATFWLVSHDSTGQLTCSGGKPCFSANIVNVCWGDIGAPVTPAVEILYFYDLTRNSVSATNNYSAVQVKRWAYDQALRGSFLSPNVGGGCDLDGDGVSELAYRSNINVNTDIDSTCDDAVGCSLLVKIRMYYADSADPQKVGIWTAGPLDALPAQGIFISSAGTAGESTRKLSVFQEYPESPTLFDSVVFSKKDLVK